MNRDNDRQTSIILAVFGILPVVWLGLLIAPSVKGGLPEILPSLMNVMSDPLHIFVFACSLYRHRYNVCAVGNAAGKFQRGKE